MDVFIHSFKVSLEDRWANAGMVPQTLSHTLQ